MNPVGPNQRKFKRAGMSFPVAYKVQSPFELRRQLGENEIDAIANDLSAGGLSLLTNYALPPGTMIHVKFRLSNNSMADPEEGSRKFDLEGEARHSSYSKESGYRVGIRFTGVTREEREFIQLCLMIRQGGVS